MSLEQGEVIRTPVDDTTAAPPVAEGVSLGDLGRILMRHKAWILRTAIVSVALAAGYLAVAKPVYTATAVVYVDPRDRPTPKEDASEKSNVPGDGLLLVESQLKIITSGEVLGRVVESQNLAKDPEFNGRGGLISGLKSIFGFGDGDDPNLAALRRLRLATTAKRNERSYVIDISVAARAPQRAADLANAIANAYLAEQANANAGFNRRISDAITSQLERMREAVSQSERAVAAYKAANNLVGARDKLVTDQELAEANTQLTTAKARLNEAQARVKFIDSIESGAAPLESLPEAIQSNTIVQLRARAADASRTEVQLARVLGPGHPDLQQAQAQVRDTQAAIKNEVKRIAQAVRNAAASERLNVQSLQTRFDSLKALAQTNEKAMVQLRELEMKANSDRVVYETYLGKAKAAAEEQGINTTNIRLISQAILPDKPTWPPTIPLLGGALFGGIFLGVLLALLRGASERLTKTPSMPDTGREAAMEGMEKVETPPPARAVDPPVAGRREQLSRLAAELLAAPAGHSVLLVRTSRDEALSLVPLELARAIDEAGQQVVVIDADLKDHVVSSRLRFNFRLGLRDILAGRVSIREAAHVLGRTGIKIIPAGIASSTPLNPQMRSALVTALRQARMLGRVIVDGGELDTISPELGLHTLVDEVIFLQTPHDNRSSDVAMLVEQLREHQIKAGAAFFDPVPQAMSA